MKKTKTKCTAYLFGKETEQDAQLQIVIKDGDRYLLTEIGDLRFWLKTDAVEATMTMKEVKRLQKRIQELEFEHQLDLSQIAYQRRQIDFLLEAK